MKISNLILTNKDERYLTAKELEQQGYGFSGKAQPYILKDGEALCTGYLRSDLIEGLGVNKDIKKSPVVTMRGFEFDYLVSSAEKAAENRFKETLMERTYNNPEGVHWSLATNSTVLDGFINDTITSPETLKDHDIAIKVETTGLNPKRDEIVYLSIYDINAKRHIGRFLVMPYLTPEWPEAQALNNISPENCKINGWLPGKILPNVLYLCAEARKVIFFNDFDKKFLEKWGLDFNKHERLKGKDRYLMGKAAERFMPMKSGRPARFMKLEDCAHACGFAYNPPKGEDASLEGTEISDYKAEMIGNCYEHISKLPPVKRQAVNGKGVRK